MRRLIIPLVLGAATLATLAMLLSGLPADVFLLHGTLMLVAWGVLLPLGGVVARYHKVTAGQRFPDEVDNPFWWNWHRGLAVVGVAIATAALVAVLRATGASFGNWHGRCGLAVMVIAWAQVLSPLLRGSKGGPSDPAADPEDPATWRGDHFDMSPRRRAFERWHKHAGWVTVTLAAGTILMGLDLVGAPDGVVAAAGALSGVWLCALLDGVLRGRWVDTYAALWAAGPHHPDPLRRTSLDGNLLATRTAGCAENREPRQAEGARV